MKPQFIIDGNAAESGDIPSIVRHIIDYLETLPDNNLLTTRNLVAHLRVSHGLVSHHTAHPALKPYRVNQTPTRVLWGNPKTIKAYIKHHHEI